MRSFELSGKKIFCDETKLNEEKNKRNRSKKKTHRRQSVRYRSWWKQGNIKIVVSKGRVSYWVHKDLTVTSKKIRTLLTAARAEGGKDEYQVRLTGIEREYWMGTEIGRLGHYGFQGTVTADDESNQKGGKMGAGYVNLRGKRKGHQRKVGREEEGSSSNRPELGWKQISKQRRQINVSYDPNMVTALRHGTGWFREVETTVFDPASVFLSTHG